MRGGEVLRREGVSGRGAGERVGGDGGGEGVGGGGGGGGEAAWVEVRA